MAKPKIVQVIRSAEIGGVEGHVCDVLSHGLRHGYNMTVVALSDVSPDKAFTDTGADIVLLSGEKWMSRSFVTNVQRSFKTAYRLYAYLRETKPDIVHLHGTRPHFVGSIAAKCAGITNVVSTLHGSYKLMAVTPDGGISTFLCAVSAAMTTIGVSLSNHVLTVSEAVREEVNNVVKLFGIRTKIATKYLGVDADLFASEALNLRGQYGIRDETTLLGSVGRLDEPKKGVTILLKAVAILKKRGCDVKVLIVGEGSSKPDLIALAADLQLSEDVIFYGYSRNTHKIYKNFDIFVLPSLSEGLGLVNLEAMAASLPVVASRVGGVAECIRPNVNGLLVTPNDPAQLAEAVQSLIADRSEAREMGKRGRAIVVREFRKEDSLRELFAMYSSLLHASS